MKLRSTLAESVDSSTIFSSLCIVSMLWCPCHLSIAVRAICHHCVLSALCNVAIREKGRQVKQIAYEEGIKTERRMFEAKDFKIRFSRFCIHLRMLGPTSQNQIFENCSTFDLKSRENASAAIPSTSLERSKWNSIRPCHQIRLLPHQQSSLMVHWMSRRMCRSCMICPEITD